MSKFRTIKRRFHKSKLKKCNTENPVLPRAIERMHVIESQLTVGMLVTLIAPSAPLNWQPQETITKLYPVNENFAYAIMFKAGHVGVYIGTMRMQNANDLHAVEYKKKRHIFIFSGKKYTIDLNHINLIHENDSSHE